MVYCISIVVSLAAGGVGIVSTVAPEPTMEEQLNTVSRLGMRASDNTVRVSILLQRVLLSPFCLCCIVGLLVSSISACMLLYQLWKLIPANIARTTPGKAVGFCFIPVFNIYWVFVAFNGLGKDMNKILQQCRIQYQINEWYGLVTSIVLCLIIPIGDWGILSFPLTGLICIGFLIVVKNGAIALLYTESV